MGLLDKIIFFTKRVCIINDGISFVKKK